MKEKDLNEENVLKSTEIKVEDYYQFSIPDKKEKDNMKNHSNFNESDFKVGDLIKINGTKSEIVDIQSNEFNELLLVVKQKDKKLKTFNEKFCHIKKC